MYATVSKLRTCCLVALCGCLLMCILYSVVPFSTTFPVGLLHNSHFFTDSFKDVKTPYISISLENIKNVTIFSKGYSNFTYHRPHFIDNDSKRLLYKRDSYRGFLDKVHTSKTFFGEVYIVKDGRFKSYKFCGHRGGKGWMNVSGNVKPENWFKVLVPLTIRYGYSFQHFQDFVSLRLLQILPFVRSSNASILLYSPRDKILYDLYDKWGITSQIIFHKEGEIYGADYLIHSCISNAYHPMLWRELRNLLGFQTKLQVPIRSAYIILLTRAGCFNCGRNILNHNETVSTLETRYGRDLVRVFNGPKPLNYSLNLFSKARIIIGCHGGGFYNMIYAPEKTAIVEFMPTKQNGQTDHPGEHVFLKIASVLNHEFWRVATPPKADKNVIVDINLLTRLLDEVDIMQFSRN